MSKLQNNTANVRNSFDSMTNRKMWNSKWGDILSVSKICFYTYEFCVLKPTNIELLRTSEVV